MLYKDACMRKSNQQNLGTIKCSNLCIEIVEYFALDEVIVCNLVFIAVNAFVKLDKTLYLEKLKHIAKICEEANIDEPRPPTSLPTMTLKTTLQPRRPMTSWMLRLTARKFALELMARANHIALSRCTGSRRQVC